MDAAVFRMESYLDAGRALLPKVNDRLGSLLRLQNTIDKSVVVEGFGYWTGEDVRLEFVPAAANSGIVFTRTDLPQQPSIPALVKYRDNKPRQTSLVNGSARVDMVEHVLAALRGLKIDNCEVRTNKPEMPGIDGSSFPFVRALEEAGIVEQPHVTPIRIVTREVRVGDNKTWIEVSPNLDGVHSIEYTLEFDEPNPIGNQRHSYVMQSERFKRDLMNCRTFLTKKEADYLLSQGICQRVKPSGLLVFGENGLVDNHLHFENECARHKILDMVGDLALAPCDWVGRFVAHRSGHALNAQCVAELETASLLIDETCLAETCGIMIRKQQLLKKCA
ncbi:MAG: UDP-3-O-acyl-N-acetylglucosamine deacetylase [Planctomycetaceae bacterium]|jgi:UDP-3-O-acyl N-acetylglucosamine deacetylase|nr:UDP-3-O-acyl-N-acetylglucosamine deacetylase [Planctomycetaceae bacterium]